jgi:hypothetical protein
MTSPRQSAALRPLGLDFDPFLYAPVGDDQHGGLLSVISALARVGVDPWEQAAMLARLPLDAAVGALSALLEKLPAGSGKPADATHVATRLVALLPNGSTRTTRLTIATALRTRRSIAITSNRLLTLVLFGIVALLLGAQLLTLAQPRLDDQPASTIPSSVKH